MTRLRDHLPTVVTVILVAAAVLHGPVAQLPNYHDFADQKTFFGIPHFVDVLSNLGFILVALWGWSQLPRAGEHPDLAPGWPGYRLLLIGLFLTGFGSAYYHLAPDNARLFWDRLPIALACAGLLAGVWGDTRRRHSGGVAAILTLVALASVVWWSVTEAAGAGDLRPYLLLQVLPVVLIPLWLWLGDADRADCRALLGAIGLYAAAKAAELLDHELAEALGVLSGHNLKHLIATFAALLVVSNLVRRRRRNRTAGGLSVTSDRRTWPTAATDKR